VSGTGLPGYQDELARPDPQRRRPQQRTVRTVDAHLLGMELHRYPLN
jgi:hypothetical protein